MAAVGHGVAGIDDEIEESELELGLVGPSGPQGGIELPGEFDAATKGVFEQVGDGGGERGDLDRGGLELLPASEGEQTADELAALLGGALGHRDDLLLLVGEDPPAFEQTESADHCSEEIVEVVGDAPGKLADCVHLLCLDKLGFERLVVGSFSKAAGIFERFAVGFA